MDYQKIYESCLRETTSYFNSISDAVEAAEKLAEVDSWYQDYTKEGGQDGIQVMLHCGIYIEKQWDFGDTRYVVRLAQKSPKENGFNADELIWVRKPAENAVIYNYYTNKSGKKVSTWASHNSSGWYSPSFDKSEIKNLKPYTEYTERDEFWETNKTEQYYID